MQQMDALRKANEVREWRAEARREVKAGDIERWCEILVSADFRIASMTLLDFLLWLPKVGEQRARRIIWASLAIPGVKSPYRSPVSLDLETATKMATIVRGSTRRAAA